MNTLLIPEGLEALIYAIYAGPVGYNSNYGNRKRKQHEVLGLSSLLPREETCKCLNGIMQSNNLDILHPRGERKYGYFLEQILTCEPGPL